METKLGFDSSRLSKSEEEIEDINDTYVTPLKVASNKREVEEIAIKSLEYQDIQIGNGEEFDNFEEEDLNKCQSQIDKSILHLPILPKTELYCRR